MDAAVIIAALELQPHPEEGGWFIETYRSDDHPQGMPGRSLNTAIYYLLSETSISAMHRLPGDEVFHHYLGDPVEVLLLHPDGHHETRVLGPDLQAGQRPQLVVPGGVWQGAVLVPGGQVALLGTTMAPGFAYPDYTHGDIAELCSQWPQATDAIRTRSRP